MKANSQKYSNLAMREDTAEYIRSLANKHKMSIIDFLEDMSLRYSDSRVEATILPNTEFKIDKNVPLPESASGQPTQFPFKDMGVGDSFFVAGKKDGIKASQCAYKWGRENGRVFSYRQRKESGVSGIRIWRKS